ncbi:anti-sigma factor domain-containing protein [Aeromicrobium sp. UC242_57]|uniref:anti-sigma factor n=1 Tax=Aeromicrobium sp. UC242_57 TaxID=3374624 RepID=UPI0037A5A698
MSTDLHSLIAPYALDALDSDERQRFETHLEHCTDCQAELAGFLETAVRLGDAMSHTPPAGLREQLMADIVKTPQERPVVTALAQRRGLRRALPRLAVAAAFLIGAVGVGGYVAEHENAKDARSQNQLMSSVLSADDVETSSKTFDEGGSVRLYLSDTADAAVVLAKNLPSPGKGKVYQVWMVDASGPRSQGYFTRSGQMVMEGVTKAQRIAVTVEPDGGSDLPTSDPVASIPL